MRHVGVFKIFGNHSSSRVNVLTLAYTPENIQQCVDYALAARVDRNKPANVRSYEVVIW